MRGPGRPLAVTATVAYEDHVQRRVLARPAPDGAGGSCRPLESAEGMNQPNRFTSSATTAGFPKLIPPASGCFIHGMVDRACFFTWTRCRVTDGVAHSVHRVFGQQLPGGLPARQINDTACAPRPGPAASGPGVPLSILLDEARRRPGAGWIMAEAPTPRP